MAINETATVEVKVNGEEAKQELKSLESIASGLKKELAEAYNAGDKSKIKQVTSELRKTEAQIKTLKKDTTALTEVMNNLDKATPKELRATLTAINKQLNSGYIKRGSAEWKMYQQQAKLVTAELQKIKMETIETTSWLERMNNGITKWGGMIATGAAALTGVSFTINKLRSNRDDKEEAQAELKALTGLDDDSIQWLTRQAEILSTSMEESGLRIRQSSDEILQAYMLIGSKKPELLGNKEALNAVTVEAMRLATAAKIDLKDAVTATTISLNMYGESADQAAKYVNVLAAGSKEGAADVSAQAATIKNAGVAAASAGVSIEQLQGTIQTLAEKGVEAEVAGTALRKFFLVLQTGPDETNPKVVGLQTALENLNKKGMTAGDIQKMFGEEAYTAASILIQNVDAVDRYTQAVTNTNIAVEQAAINSDTNRAKLEQHKNAIKEAGIELAERLNPSIMTLSSLTTKIITVLPSLIDWFIKYKDLIILIVGSLGTYTAGLKLATLWEERLKVAKSASVVVDKAKVLWTKAVTSASYLQAAAMFLLTSRMSNLNTSIKLSIAALKLFFSTLKLNPFAAILTAVTALGFGIYKLVTYTSDADKAFKDFSRNNTQQQTELYKLYDAIRNTNEGSQRRVELIKEFNDKYGSYLGNLLSEKASVLDVAKAYKEVSVAIQNKLALEEIEKKKSEITNESLEDRADAMSEFQSVLSRKLTSSTTDNIRNEIIGYVDNMVKKGYTEKQITNAISNSLYKKYGKSLELYDLSDAKEAIRDYVAIVKDDYERIYEIENKFGALIVKTKENKKALNELPEVVITPNNNVNTNTVITETSKDKPSAVEIATKAETERYYEELSQLKKSYLNSDTMTEKDYQALSEDLERQHLEKMLEIVGLEPEKRRQIQDKLLEMQIQYKEQCKQLDEQEKEENSELAFTRLEKEAQLKLDAAAQNHYAGLSSEREYHQQLLDIQNEYYNQVLSSTEISEEKKAEIMDRIQRDSLEKSRRNYEENQAKIREQLSFAQGIGQQFGEAFAEMLTDSETSLGDFMKATLGIILDSLQKMMIAYIAETQMKNIATLGFLGLAKAAAEIALITAAFQTAKAVINGFEEGGYTGYGKHDEPKGIVHAGEFVANRYAVSNPSVRPVLDLIDRAQKNNTIGSLTAKDVSAVLSGVSSTTNNTYYQQAAPVDNGMSAVMLEAVKVMGALNKRLNEPIYTYTKATGKMGINEAQDLVTRMKNNASRRIRL
ncbi:phage tail tape measure protein [uncultured Bacteroides sp.]|uniref:phage tail tape measure protein n=1 Tax=uncultured Bacteroides sp. TaxID=162156 RepID=UPI0026166FB9|nr:phage tail tape measure protein [uncultured Bacteroides sp.]